MKRASSTATQRTRARKRIPGLTARIAAVCALLSLVGVAAYAAIAKFYQPYAMQGDEQSHIRQLSSQLASTESTNKDLERQVMYLNRPDGIVMTARSMGYIKHGEESVVVEPPVPPTPPPADPSFLTRVSSAFHALLKR